MTRKEAKILAPIIKAFGEDKRIIFSEKNDWQELSFDSDPLCYSIQKDGNRILEDGLEVDDIIVDPDNNTKAVLAVTGRVIILSSSEDYGKANDYFTLEELINGDFTLENNNNKEVTLEEISKVMNIPLEQLKIKK